MILKYYLNLHTTYLFIDIQVKEPTWESITKKKKEYQPSRYMEVKQAVSQLLDIIKNNEFEGENCELYFDCI